MPMTAADIRVDVGANTSQFDQAMGQADQTLQNTGKKASASSLAMGVLGGAIFAGFGMAISGAMGYEDAMAQVSASVRGAEGNMEALGNLAQQIGAETAFSAAEGAAAIEALGMAGLNAEQILGGAAMATADLAAATGTAMPEAATIMANTMDIFSLSADQARGAADSMTGAMLASGMSMNDIALGLSNLGPTAAQAGLSLEQTVAAMGLMVKNGIPAANAGTALRNVIQSMAAPTAEAQTWFNQLGISMDEGIASGDLMGYTAEKLKAGLADLSPAARLAALETMFGADAAGVAAILYKEGAAGVAEMTEASQANGQAAETAKKRMNSLRGALDEMMGSLETVMISFGTMALPILTKAAKGATTLLNGILKLNKGIKTGIAVVLGVVGAIGLLAGGMGTVTALAGPMLAPMLTAMSALLAPIALLVGAIVGIGIAYKTNFLGFADLVNRVGDALVTAGQFMLQLGSAMATAFGEGQGISQLIKEFPGPLQATVEAILLVADAFGDLWSAFQSGGFQGLLKQLPEELGQIGNALKQLAGEALGALVTAFQSIPWGTIGDTLWAGLLTAWEVLKDIAPPIIAKLGDLAVDLGTWVAEQAGKVDWAGILRTAASKAGSIVSTVIGKLGDLALGLKNWYDRAINSVNWGSLGQTVGQKVGDVARALAPKAWELITGFGRLLQENWREIGKVLLGLILGLPAAIGYIGLTLLPKAAEFVAGFIEGLGINWPLIGNWLLSNIWKLPLVIPYLAYMLVPKAAEFIQGFIDGLDINWGRIGTWLVQNLLNLALAIPVLAGVLVPKAWELIQGVVDGLVQKWPDVKNWLAATGTRAFEAVGEVTESLFAKGVNLLWGLQQGIEGYWKGTVKPWLQSLDDLVIGAIGETIEWLYDQGMDILWGLYDGVSEAYWGPGGLDELLESFKGAITDNFLGAINWLFQSGKDVVQGLINGANAVKGSLETLVDEIIGIWNKIPGMGDSPWPIMIGAGQDAVNGLILGAKSREDALASQIGSILGTMTGNGQLTGEADFQAGGRNAVAVAPAGRSQQVIYNDHRTFTVKVDDLPELVQAKAFFQDLQRDHELVFSGTYGSQ